MERNWKLINTIKLSCDFNIKINEFTIDVYDVLHFVTNDLKDFIMSVLKHKIIFHFFISLRKKKCQQLKLSILNWVLLFIF